MKLFINDKPIKVIQYVSALPVYEYNTIIGATEEILSVNLIGKVLIKQATPRQLERLIRIMELKRLKKLVSITFAVDDYEFMVEFIKDQFKVIKASGGVVRKQEKILLIFRLGKWDLPKGKLKKKEESIKCAKREVEEECSIKVDVKDKICSTWHAYVRKGKRILKRTDWYEMNCLDDSNMQPQLAEFIEDLKWMNYKDVIRSVKNSYASIQEVIDEYYRLHSELVR
ncbi:NUDIX hydrolase [Cytophaga aurantiaca]|uniref:NUDIX hydrolase n=1 Tax=Cytophaga aurantiaca TaxID=29530 RepID=UPI000377E3B8|nr:NUDIX hydrolase [Cytophaga aurantiaca]